MMNFGMGGFGMILFWIIVLGVAALAIKGIIGLPNNHESGRVSPLNILKQRYASGEISQEEYERKKQEIIK